MNKINSILFPVDFSPVALNAIDFVVDIAGHTAAFVTIFHATHIPAMVEVGVPPLLLTDQQKIAEERLQGLESDYPIIKTIPHRFDATIGWLEMGIKHFLDNENEKVDLIIMGTGGAHGVKEYLGGTTTMNVISRSTVPVLVIPGKAHFKRPKKIAFAYDYNGITNAATLDVLKTLVDAYQAEFHIFNIAENQKGFRDNDLSSIEIIEKEFGNVHYDTRMGTDIEKEIENYVMLNGIDMLAVLPREHGFFERLFKETITEKLAYHSLLPVLVLR